MYSALPLPAPYTDVHILAPEIDPYIILHHNITAVNFIANTTFCATPLTLLNLAWGPTAWFEGLMHVTEPGSG
jgi:hypothetical protein